MKPFDRFVHAGVFQYLKTLRDYFADDPQFSFGSSGEGELTIKGPDRTAYVRKFKSRDGWRVVVFRGSVEEDRRTLASAEDVRQHLLERLL